MDRRALFFVVAAVVAAALILPTEEQHRWVPIALSITYAVLAAASWLDRRTRDRAHPDH